MIEERLVSFTLPYSGIGERRVRVYVPAHEEGETFPVIYMTDGQNLFDEYEGMFGCWHTREAVKAEQKRSAKAAIIVGVHNDISPAQRNNELTPRSIGKLFFPDYVPEEVKQSAQPEGEVFDDFVLNTVMPAIQARFPVMTGRTAAAVCGSSSGGLQAFFTAVSHPDVFCAAGVFSPCFMLYSREDLRDWIRSQVREVMPYLYIYSGAGDELEQEICRSVERTYDDLLECYPMEKLNEIILPDQPHHESAWEPVFQDFLHTFLIRREDL